MEFSMLLWPVRLLKLVWKLFCTIDIQGRESYTGDYIKDTINNGMGLEAYKLKFFQTWKLW